MQYKVWMQYVFRVHQNRNTVRTVFCFSRLETTGISLAFFRQYINCDTVVSNPVYNYYELYGLMKIGYHLSVTRFIDFITQFLIKVTSSWFITSTSNQMKNHQTYLFFTILQLLMTKFRFPIYWTRPRQLPVDLWCVLAGLNLMKLLGAYLGA